MEWPDHAGVLGAAPSDWPATLFLYYSRQRAQGLICFR
jgi:hypothetical protein